jgi:hypothetical protein
MSDPAKALLTPGRLADNGMTVLSLQSSLSRSDKNLSLVPRLIQDLTRDSGWQAYTLGDSPRVYRWNAAQFRRFIEAPRREGGCETPISILERTLRGTDAWETFLDLTRGKPGNPTGTNQHTVGNCDNVTDSSSPVVSEPPPTGNSVSYALRRLKKERPDLYERVKAEEMSAHAAMVEAGFRKTPTALEQGKRAWLKMTTSERSAFRAWQETTP